MTIALLLYRNGLRSMCGNVPLRLDHPTSTF